MASAPIWSATDLKNLDLSYPILDWGEMMSVFGRSKDAIRGMASKRGLHRDFKPSRKKRKVCKACGVEKSRNEYDSTSRGGTRGLCRYCYNKRRYAAIKSDPEKYQKKIHLSPDDIKRRYRQQLLYKYGITPEDYKSLLEIQGGRCAICERTGRRMGLDHDHVTGRIRAFLCWRCNLAIAILEDSPWRKKAEAYLEEYKR